MKKLLLLLIFITSNLMYSQVGIGTDMPNPSTQLEIVSSNRGILIPQVSLSSNTDQTTIAAGNLESLLVYNTNTSATLSPGYYYWYQGRWNKLMVETDLPDNIVFWDVVNNQFTYIDANGNVQIINISDLETLTYFGLNVDGHTLDYTDEDGIVTSIDLETVIKNFETLTTIVANSDGTFTFTDEAGITTIVDISDLETLTTIALNADNVHIDYMDEDGVLTQLNLTQIVKNLETVTTIEDNGDGTITYTNENNDAVVINLAAGPQGPAGADGVDGVDGTNGTNGTNGTDGISAYEEWIAAGNTGTEQDFLDSLVGADGADGADGVDGTDGTNGTDGISAYEEWIAAGNTGTEQDFLDSLIGADGADGADGTDGVDGTNGTDGISAYEEWIAA
ncbi:MAG TPA: hypothetical protein VKY47_03205, partial [Xanthomarina sp.]|nr:hypothetical protein [Xanthomarina sp.]